MSGAQQNILDENNRASLNLARLGADQSGRLSSLLGRRFDDSALPDAGRVDDIRETSLDRLGTGPDLRTEFGDAGNITRSYGTDFSNDRQRVEDALFDRMEPLLDRDRDRLESRLASQGIRLGSEAYENAMSDFGRQANDARLGAILNAGQEQNRLAGLERDRAGFENAAQAQAFNQEATRTGFANQAENQAFDNRARGIAMGNQAALQETNADIARFNAANDARNQALQQQFAIRNQPLNEIAALMSGSQIQNPNFITPNVAGLPTTDFAGLQRSYDAQLQNDYQQRLGNRNSLIGGLFGLGNAFIGRPR